MSCLVTNNSTRTRQHLRHAQSDNPISHSSSSNISLLSITAQNPSKATTWHFSFSPSVKHPSTITHTHCPTMPRFTNNDHDTPSKPSLTKRDSSIVKSSPKQSLKLTASPNPLQSTFPPCKPSIAQTVSNPQRLTATSTSSEERKVSITQKSTSLPRLTSRKQPLATPQSTQQQKVSITLRPSSPPQLARQRKSSATPELSLSSRASPPRKVYATPKSASPPKPDWIAPPEKYCTPSPTQIPLPTFVSSVRKECSPLLGTRARAVNTSSSLACQISDVESIATVSTDGDRSGGVRLSVKRTDEAEERPGEWMYWEVLGLK
jgi:hypothetical protein